MLDRLYAEIMGHDDAALDPRHAGRAILVN